jgi:hypothetical protein
MLCGISISFSSLPPTFPHALMFHLSFFFPVPRWSSSLLYTVLHFSAWFLTACLPTSFNSSLFQSYFGISLRMFIFFPPLSKGQLYTPAFDLPVLGWLSLLCSSFPPCFQHASLATPLFIFRVLLWCCPYLFPFFPMLQWESVADRPCEPFTTHTIPYITTLSPVHSILLELLDCWKWDQ